ncbi:hypothetical protein PMIN01_05679 [Paraphaeosphaeria minitans]|uniref:Uncharacterized protein n=1 Tax=Paraphaeosphaeria minitans TaxID=565426 RepID=A0A9P6GI11_9PLEO|nr:hypothetical protein PMIN01_05679 [Paraphaeosphaeria minitans]
MAVKATGEDAVKATGEDEGQGSGVAGGGGGERWVKERARQRKADQCIVGELRQRLQRTRHPRRRWLERAANWGWVGRQAKAIVRVEMHQRGETQSVADGGRGKRATVEEAGDGEEARRAADTGQALGAAAARPARDQISPRRTVDGPSLRPYTHAVATISFHDVLQRPGPVFSSLPNSWRIPVCILRFLPWGPCRHCTTASMPRSTEPPASHTPNVDPCQQ